MQRRVFIVILIILAIATVIVAALVWQSRTTGPAAEESVEKVIGGEPTAIPMVEVIVARQPIARGGEFTDEALGITTFPQSSLPPNTIGSKAETFGKIANSAIVQGQPIVYDLLRDKASASTGDAAFDIPSGHVMVAFPINKQTSVAYALQPGDVVDVLMTFSIVNLDPDFQTVLPNKFSFLLQDIQSTGEEGGGEKTSHLRSARLLMKVGLTLRTSVFPALNFPEKISARAG